MQQLSNNKYNQINSQRPQTSKPLYKIGQEQSINNSPKNDLKGSQLKKSQEVQQLRDSDLIHINDKQTKNSPPLFKYKPKFVAKHFDPFQELEEKQLKDKIQQAGEASVQEKQGSQVSLNSLNSSHKFKRLSSKELNMLSPIPPQMVNVKNVFFDEKNLKSLTQNDDQTATQSKKTQNQIKNEEQKEKNEDEQQLEILEVQQLTAEDEQKLNEEQALLNKVKEIKQRIRPQTAVILKAPPIKNIFDSAKVYEQYQKNEIGPQYGEDGQLKQYSVLGKTDWFMKQQKDFNKKNKHQTYNNNDISINVETKGINVDSKSNLSNDNKDTSINKQISRTVLGGGSRTVLGGNTVPKVISMNNFTFTTTHIPKQKNRNKEDADLLVQDLDDDDVQDCIDKAIQRVQSNKEFVKQQNQQQISQFKKGDQLYLTKEQRILQQFEDLQKKQEKLIDYNCKKVGKKYQSSVYLREGETRNKIEVKQILEMVKTDFEKYGAQNFWQKRLRKDKEDRVLAIEAIQQLVKEENPLNFRPKNQFDSQKKVQVVEQVRKPLSSKLRTEMQNELPFHSFKSHDYLQEILSDRKNYINEIARIENKDIDHIEVIGKNVLRSEIEALKNNMSSKNFVMKIRQQKISTQPTQPHTPPEETKKHQEKQNKSPKNKKIVQNKPNTTTTNTRSHSPKFQSYSNLRSVVKIQILPEKPAMEYFLEKQQNLKNQEEEIIEEKYIPYEMRRGGYVSQQIKMHF